ncbi:hypothetical protein [Mangrovicoccus sp. HB161399]|uniref:hypothetical protein n=1 Tax=Mangrovicoccus sp. HB161399 TaxID=2720392 RepID=UPI001552B73F|nr:hypothetical protein [Mangrovicoccus sp. HB161399]
MAGAFPRALTGAGTESDQRPLNTNAGLLIGLRFGGPAITWNLVPIHADFSQHGAWAEVERSAKRIADANGSNFMDAAIGCENGHGVRRPTAFAVGTSAAAAPGAQIAWS